MRAAAGLLFLFAIGAAVAGALEGRAVVDSPHGDFWAALAGLCIASAAPSVVFTASIGVRGTLGRRLAMASIASFIPAGLISGAFLIAVNVKDPEACNGHETCVYTGGYLVLWGATSALGALAGTVASCITMLMRGIDR